MTNLFPVVDNPVLPVTELRAPFDSQSAAFGTDSPADAINLDALCEQLVPLISTAIARKARQRRYTP